MLTQNHQFFDNFANYILSKMSKIGQIFEFVFCYWVLFYPTYSLSLLGGYPMV